MSIRIKITKPSFRLILSFTVFLSFFFMSIHGTMYAQKNKEMRGVWITYTDSNLMKSDSAISEAMEFLSKTGINVIFPSVYCRGFTLYPSTVMQKTFGAVTLNDPSLLKRDFLKTLVIEAHRYGIEVIPWFEYGFASSYKSKGGHIVKLKKHWALLDNKGLQVTKNGFDWISAINPECQDFIISLIMEVVNNYDIDGIQIDDRLPAMPVEGGYDQVTSKIYSLEHNGSLPPFDFREKEWTTWRMEKLTGFLSRLRDSVKLKDTNLIISCSPNPYFFASAEYLQDTKKWLKEKLVDNFIPQLFRYELNKYKTLLHSEIQDQGDPDSMVFFPGLLIKNSSYIINPDTLEEMISYSRTKGLKGWSLFFYEGLREHNSKIGHILQQNSSKAEYYLPYRNNNWRPMANIIKAGDALSKKHGHWQEILSNAVRSKYYIASSKDTGIFFEYRSGENCTGEYDIYAYIDSSIFEDSSVSNRQIIHKASYSISTSNGTIKTIIDQSEKSGWIKLASVSLKNEKVKIRVEPYSSNRKNKIQTSRIMILLSRKPCR